MRTIAEIKKVMTDAVLADAVLAEALGLDSTKSWESQTSSVSVINLMMYVVAVGQYALEWMFEQFKADVEKRIAAALPGSVSWLWNRAMEYQDGASANAYYAEHGVYEGDNPEARIVKYAAVVEKYNGVLVKVNGEGYDPIDGEQLASFTAYMNRLKFAGTRLQVSSIQSDDMDITVNVWTDPLVMPEADEQSIGDAVTGYLDGIRYGGTFNKTLLLDAVRRVPGIIDATVGSCVFTAHDAEGTATTLTGQNYESVAGHIVLHEINIVQYR